MKRHASSNDSTSTRTRPSEILAPVAVLEIHLEALPDLVDGLDRYRQAHVLFRYKRRPVARLWVDVQDGRLSGEELRLAFMEAADWAFWFPWLHDYLGWQPNCYLDGSLGQNASPLPLVTVAICTRDRPEDLRRCLQALTRLPDDGQEILVVDSCSRSDEPRAVVADFPQVRYLREPYPGLNRARNRALKEASHPIIAFLDDDVIPDRDWLRNITRNFSDPRVMCVCGLTMPLELETEAQVWFEHYTSFSRGFYRKEFDKDNLHPLAAGQAGAGASMALRSEVLSCVGLFDESLDAGTPTHSGGDTEMFSRILEAGYRIVYEPAILSWHRHRKTWQDLRKVIYGYGVGTYAYWTKRLLEDGQWSVFLLAWYWAWQTQFPNLLKSLLRLPGSTPVDLLLQELKGCLAGPRAYRTSCRRLKALAESIEEDDSDLSARKHYYSHS
jgi:GT2 family glycosyltransferase